MNKANLLCRNKILNAVVYLFVLYLFGSILSGKIYGMIQQRLIGSSNLELLQNLSQNRKLTSSELISSTGK